MKTPFTTAVLSALAFALLLGGPGAGASASAETPTVIIKSYKEPERLLTVQDGAPLADPAAVQSPAAQWRLEATGEASFMRFFNVGSGLYLQNDGGRPVVGPIAPGSRKADWTLEIVPGHADARIHSRVGAYLHTNDGPLAIGEAPPQWDASYWTIVPFGGDADRITLGPTGLGPDATPKVGTGDLTLPLPVLVPVPGGNRPPITIPTCPAGKHLTNGHCCPGLEFWNAGTHTCAMIPIKVPKLCPAGQHLSSGHCCPNLAVWNAASHTCTMIPIKGQVCPAGQHLSSGHCCPNLAVWNAASHKCALIPIKAPGVCPPGKHLTNGHCCHNGYVWINGCRAGI